MATLYAIQPFEHYWISLGPGCKCPLWLQAARHPETRRLRRMPLRWPNALPSPR